MNQADMRAMTDESFRSYVGIAEYRLELSKGFIFDIKDRASDWEFITQLGMIIEAMLTDTIVQTLHNEKVRDHIATTSQANRLKLATQLGILPKLEAGQLKQISEIRNGFAHRVANVSKSLEEYVEGLDAGNRGKVERAFQQPGFVSQANASWRDRIFYTAVFCLMTLVDSTMKGILTHSFRDLAEDEYRKSNPLSVATFPAKLDDTQA